MRVNPFETGAKKYDKWFENNPNIFESELEALKLCYEQNKKSIEIGVGTGIFAEKLGVVEGVEPADEMASLAKMRGIQITKANAESLPFDDESYEQVLMITVECFLDDIHKAFLEVKRILKTGGSFVVAFINKASKLGQIYEQNKGNDEIYKWAEFRTADEIIEILTKSGFKIEKTCQTVTDFEDKIYDVKSNYGEGVFTVIKATR